MLLHVRIITYEWHVAGAQVRFQALTEPEILEPQPELVVRLICIYISQNLHLNRLLAGCRCGSRR